MEIPETLDGLRHEEQQLLDQLEGLKRRLTLVRVAIAQHKATEPSSDTMSDRVVAVLNQGGVMSPSEIVEVLRTDAPDVHARSIGGVLNALKKRGRVGNPGRGRWVSLDS